MRHKLTVPMILVAGLVAPPVATAADPLDGWYQQSAADSRRPRLDLDVKQRRGKLDNLAGVRCLRSSLRLPSNQFKIRGGRFSVTIRLAPPRAPGNPRDRVVMRGRWTSPRSVNGRLRVVQSRAGGRYCDSGWRTWRAGLVGSFGVRTSVPDDFAVPGTVTTTVTVFNDGDYDSRNTQVTVLPRALDKPGSARPAPLVSTTQGSCQWPTSANWADWTDLDFESAILCQLGRVPARSTATITITDSWSLQHCAYNEDGEAFVTTYWDPALRSPLLVERGWEQYGAGFDTTGQCPSLAPDN